MMSLMFCVVVNQGPILQFKLSDIGEGIMEVTVKEWCVRDSFYLKVYVTVQLIVCFFFCQVCEGR